MQKEIKQGDCVKIPDRIIGRVRGTGDICKVQILNHSILFSACSSFLSNSEVSFTVSFTFFAANPVTV